MKQYPWEFEPTLETIKRLREENASLTEVARILRERSDEKSNRTTKRLKEVNKRFDAVKGRKYR